MEDSTCPWLPEVPVDVEYGRKGEGVCACVRGDDVQVSWFECGVCVHYFEVEFACS